MENMTEKFSREELAMMSPYQWASLLRRTEVARDGDKVEFAGRTLIVHRYKGGCGPCWMCCFDFVEDLCDFVSCLPEERYDDDDVWYTIEPKGKEVSHE